MIEEHKELEEKNPEGKFRKYLPNYSGMDVQEICYTSRKDYKGRVIDYHMDLMRLEGDHERRPVIAFVHGGGFIQPCDRKQAYISWIAQKLLSEGYVVISPDYPIYDQAEDFQTAGEKTAIREAGNVLHELYQYLKREEEKLLLDMNCAVLMGGSAGGWASYGAIEQFPQDWDLFVNLWGATANVPDVKAFPPVYTVHGTEDQVVPCAREYPIHKALDEAGVVNVLQLLEGADHTPVMRTDEYLPNIYRFIKENVPR
ncbi:MAG: alpha/beta hydrolase [Eubacteriales bacterium]|nr:alpha/beta hydrolase [Eubacteriales bacterium]